MNILLTVKSLQEIYNKIISDEAFCRLVAYGEKPLDISKPNIIGSSNHKQLMSEIIYFAPQIPDLEKESRCRICLYKSTTKIGSAQKVIRDEIIEFDIYVPHRLITLDLRIYNIESKIESILDGYDIEGMGYLDYISGYFVPIPQVSGYAEYKMLFAKVEGRSKNGRL